VGTYNETLLPSYPDQRVFPMSVVTGHVFLGITEEFSSGDIFLTTHVCYVSRQTGYTPVRLSNYVNVVSSIYVLIPKHVVSQHFLTSQISVGRKSLTFTVSSHTANHNRKIWSFYGPGLRPVIIIDSE